MEVSMGKSFAAMFNCKMVCYCVWQVQTFESYCCFLFCVIPGPNEWHLQNNRFLLNIQGSTVHYIIYIIWFNHISLSSRIHWGINKHYIYIYTPYIHVQFVVYYCRSPTCSAWENSIRFIVNHDGLYIYIYIHIPIHTQKEKLNIILIRHNPKVQWYIRNIF